MHVLNILICLCKYIFIIIYTFHIHNTSRITIKCHPGFFHQGASRKKDGSLGPHNFSTPKDPVFPKANNKVGPLKILTNWSYFTSNKWRFHKNMGKKTPKSSHLFIGLEPLFFTIHFGGFYHPYFWFNTHEKWVSFTTLFVHPPSPWWSDILLVPSC